MISQRDGTPKHTVIAIFISNKLNFFQAKINEKKYVQGHYMLMKQAILQEDITIIS
jgi:hypothetical protein